MGLRGPHSKSVEAKILAGTFREDRDGSLESAVLAAGTPVKPADLSPEASAFWDANVPALVAKHGVGAQDTAELTAMAEWWGRYRRASAQLDRLKSLATPTARKLSIQAADAFRCFNLIACRFGLTPADRTRLKVQPEKKAGVATRRRA